MNKVFYRFKFLSAILILLMGMLFIGNTDVRGASIADLVGEAKVSTTEPYSGANFEMDILINSRSNGAETQEGIKGYTVSFKVPDNVDFVTITDSGMYTVTPSNPKTGDTVTIKYKDELQMAKLQKIKATFRFKEGISTPSETFQPEITLSADNADGTKIQPPLVTAKNIELPTIMEVKPDGENPTFVHTAKVNLKAENYIGGLNHTDAKVKITFPEDADIEYVRYNGQNYPITTDPSGEQIVEIPVNDFKVGQNAEISLVYRYPVLTTPGTKEYQIKIEYTANRYGINQPVSEAKTIDEEVSFYDGAGDSGQYFDKYATSSILRRANEPISFEINFHPVGDTKDVAIIDDPVRGVETDFFSGVKYVSFRWNAYPGSDPAFGAGISTKIYYQTSTTGDTWHDAGPASTNGTLSVSSFGLVADQEVTKVKYEFSYKGSNEVPAQAGRVRILAFTTSTSGITATGNSLDNGITNSAYIVGQKKGTQSSTYENIVDDGVENLKTSKTDYTNGAYCGFITGYPAHSPDFENNVFDDKTPTKIGETFKYRMNIVNMGTPLKDTIQYIVVPKTLEVQDITFPGGQGNATWSIITKDATRQVIVVRFNDDMPYTGYNENTKFQVIVTLKALPGVNSSENIQTFFTSGTGQQQQYATGGEWEWRVPFGDNTSFYTGNGCRQQSPKKQFDLSLEATPVKLASTDDVDYAQTATRVVQNASGDDGWYSISATNSATSESDLTEARIIDMLPTLNDTMTISENDKKSTFNPIVQEITMADGSALNMSNYELYYSMNATAADNKAELEDFDASVSTTWNTWTGTTPLPADTKAIKIVKKDGLAKNDTVSFKLRVKLPYGTSGIKVGWNSISLGGKYGTDSYIVPGEPNKAGIYISDTPADKKLAGTIWEDMNGNDLRDSGEPTMSGMTVRLYDWDDSLVATTTTDPNGHYEFNGLYPAYYRVEYDNKITYHMSKYKVGSDTTVDSNFTGLDGDEYIGTATVNLASEPSPLNVDAGLYRYVSVGDYVWEDLNDNGLQDTNESGIGNAKVSLYRVGLTKAESLVDTKTTDGSGKYIFKDIKPGNFVIRVQQISDLVATNYQVGGATATNNSKLQDDWSSEQFTVNSNEAKMNMDFGLSTADALGTITLTKVDEADEPLAGATFGIWASDADLENDEPIATAISNGSGVVTFGNVAIGDYKVKEVSAPSGYVLSTTVYNASVTDDNLLIDLGEISNDLIKGNVTLFKLDENNAGLAGATFGIWASDKDPENDDALQEKTSVATTGKVEFTDLVPGDYIVKEITAPGGYVLKTTTYDVTVPADGATVNIGNITNELIKGKVTLTKVGEQATTKLSGATFGIWANDKDPETDTALQTDTSGADGIIEFTDLLPGTYKVKETAAPGSYVLDNTIHTVTIPADGSSVDLGNISNTLIKGSVSLTKVDEDNEGLAGVVFGIWNKGDDPETDAPIKELTTPTSGEITFEDIIIGEYFVKEISAPSGYQVSATEYPVNITETNLEIDLGEIVNSLTRGSVTLTKIDENDEMLEGATFGIWASDKDPETDTPIATMTTTSTGIITFTNLLPGDYIVKETNAPEGYKLSATTHNASVTLDVLNYDIGEVENEPVTGTISLVKFDEDNAALPGATFGIWASDADLENDAPIKTAESQADGTVTFTDLPVGSYKVKETNAPDGYVLSTTVYEKTITIDALNQDIGNVTNDLIKGKVTLTKVGEQASIKLSGATFGIWANDKDPETDTALQTDTSGADGLIEFTDLLPGTYKVKETAAPGTYVLDNTVRTVTIPADGSTQDLGNISNTLIKGSINFKKVDENNDGLAGAVFGVWEAGADLETDPALAQAISATTTGSVTFTNLVPGEYIIKEISAPSGYHKVTTEYPVTIIEDDLAQTIADIENELIKGSVEFLKYDEYNNVLPGVEFGIWENDKDPETDTALKTATSTVTGKVLFDDLIPGIYKVKETKALTGYVLDTSIYTVEITETDLNKKLDNVVNYQIKGSISLTKVGETDNELVGATFGIWKEGQDPSKVDPLMIGETQPNTYFPNLVPGDYIVKEISAPNGYDLDTKEYKVKITLDDLDIDLGKIENKLTRGNVALTKVDENGTTLAGAEFGIWEEDSDVTSDEPLIKTTSNEEGKVSFEALLPGKYKVKEISAPTGYTMIDKVYDVEVALDNLNINVGKVENPRILGNITLTKVDENRNALAGAVFGLYERTTDKLVEKKSSDSEGKIVFTKVIPAEYYVKEISAPKGYDLVEKEYSASVKLTDLELDLGEVVNKKSLKKTTPTTGQDLSTLLVLLSSTIALSGVYLFRRKTA